MLQIKKPVKIPILTGYLNSFLVNFLNIQKSIESIINTSLKRLRFAYFFGDSKDLQGQMIFV